MVGLNFQIFLIWFAIFFGYNSFSGEFFKKVNFTPAIIDKKIQLTSEIQLFDSSERLYNGVCTLSNIKHTEI